VNGGESFAVRELGMIWRKRFEDRHHSPGSDSLLNDSVIG